jgi:hypothetical protein
MPVYQHFSAYARKTGTDDDGLEFREAVIIVSAAVIIAVAIAITIEPRGHS